MHRKQQKSRRTAEGLVSPIDARVAAQISRLRLEKKFTQAELARRCQLSAAYLSRVESNEAALTLTNLARVAEALEVPVAALLSDEEANAPLSVYRAGTGKIGLLRGKGSNPFVMLAAEKRGKLMEPLVVTEVKATGPATELHSHAGEEFDYLLEGRCTFYYGKDVIALEAGDAVYYDASVPHGICGEPGVKSRLLVVASSRDYLYHGDIARLLESR